MRLPLLVINDTSQVRANVSFFIYCLLAHIMYIIQTKATLIIIEVINPKNKNIMNSIILIHLLTPDKVSRFESGNAHICSIHFLCA